MRRERRRRRRGGRITLSRQPGDAGHASWRRLQGLFGKLTLKGYLMVVSSSFGFVLRTVIGQMKLDAALTLWLKYV